MCEHLEGKGSHREQQQHIHKTTKGPTADDEQQEEGQDAEKDDPEHCCDTYLAVNRLLQYCEGRRAAAGCRPFFVVTKLSVFRHIEGPSPQAYNLCATILSKLGSNPVGRESFGSMGSSKVE